MFSFPLMQELSTRNPCRGAQGNECGAAAYTLKAALKAPDSSQISQKSAVEVGSIWISLLLHPPFHFKAWSLFLHLPLPSHSSGVRPTYLQSNSCLSAHTTAHLNLPPPHTTVPSPSLHCSPAFSFPPSCSSCHNLFGFAQMNVRAKYHRGMASSVLLPLQPSSFLHCTVQSKAKSHILTDPPLLCQRKLLGSNRIMLSVHPLKVAFHYMKTQNTKKSLPETFNNTSALLLLTVSSLNSLIGLCLVFYLL